MDNIKFLDKYLEDNFSDLLLRKPLFYNSKIGIRFEIGNPDIDYRDKKYMEGVYARSIKLFEKLFYPDTDIYLVANSHISNENIEDKNQAKELLRGYLINEKMYGEIECIKLPWIYQDEDDDEELLINTFRHCLSCKVKDVDFKRLLKAIGNHDMGIEPSFHDEVFFINKNSHIIYHLYDDRGLDIVSNKVSTLEHIYMEYNQWILDYDRKTINQIFEKHSI